MIGSAQCFQFINENREVVYEYVGQIMVGARASIDDESTTPPPPTGWKVRGTLKLQRRDASTISAAVSISYFGFTGFTHTLAKMRANFSMLTIFQRNVKYVNV